jgi:murein DD-endopeptidase MepM/ murein hydrolase activator NlpD
MALVFAALLGLNLYIFVLKPKTSVRELLKSSELAKQGASASIATGQPGTPAPAPVPVKPKAPAADEDDARVVETAVHLGEPIARVLQLEGVSLRDANDVVAALATVRQGKLEGALTLRWDAEERLRGVELREGAAPTWRAERDRDGWHASRDDRPVQTKVVEVGGVVGASLFDAVKRSGESPSLASAIADVLAWDVGFYVDAQPTDRFKVIVEKRLAGGKLLRYGRVLAVEYQGRTGIARAFWFQPDGAGGGYYTEHGEAVQKGLVRAPLKYVRVPASFDRRKLHPLAHVERGVPGVDFGAPAGTPVWAMADGRVASVGPRPGAGNAVVITHAGGLETTYTHLGRLAHGLKPGQEIRQKQVIGYVGLLPGVPSPHLHFAVRQSAAWIDPFKLKPARGAPLIGTQRVEFVDQIATRLSALAAIDTHERAAAALP